MKSRREISNKENLITTGEIWKFFLETLLLLCIPYPFLSEYNITLKEFSGDDEVIYEINQILSIFTFLRVILLSKILLSFTYYLSPRAYRLW